MDQPKLKPGQTRLSPEARAERAKKAYLAGAVNTVITRMHDLTAEQFDALNEAVLSRALT